MECGDIGSKVSTNVNEEWRLRISTSREPSFYRMELKPRLATICALDAHQRRKSSCLIGLGLQPIKVMKIRAFGVLK
jgi:hypothetical protein